MIHETKFLQFWRAMNIALASLHMPPAAYRSARDGYVWGNRDPEAAAYRIYFANR
jgi:hypothetical protein